MTSGPFSSLEIQDFKKHFGKDIKEITLEEFEKIRKQLRQKYHPDNFEKHGDETIKEMAVEKFQQIEALCNKAKYYLENKFASTGNSEDEDASFLDASAQFSFDGMSIDIITSDKDLKYHLFGTSYRWLEQGDKFKIPKTEAYIRIEADYRGNAVGFKETIKMFLTFGINDSVKEINEWLYNKIEGRASSLIIEKNIVAIDLNEMNYFIRKKSFLNLEYKVK